MTSTGSTAPAEAGEDLVRRGGGETVLITGASSGIGRELARQFARDGADLVLSAAARAGCGSWPATSPRNTGSQRRSCPLT